MSLRWVHAGLILLSAMLAVLFGLWCLTVYRQGGGTLSLLAAIAAFVVSLGLIAYDNWFWRKTRMLR